MTDKDKKLIEQKELISISYKLIGEIIDNYEADAVTFSADLYNELKFHWKQLNKNIPLESEFAEQKPQRTAEDYFQSRHGGKPSEQMLKDNEMITPTYAVQLMEDYAEEATDRITELFAKPLRELRPLQDLWRQENSPDKFIIPDATEFYKWIVSKVNAQQFQKPLPAEEEIEKQAEKEVGDCLLIPEEGFICGANWVINNYMK